MGATECVEEANRIAWMFASLNMTIAVIYVEKIKKLHLSVAAVLWPQGDGMEAWSDDEVRSEERADREAKTMEHAG